MAVRNGDRVLNPVHRGTAALTTRTTGRRTSAQPVQVVILAAGMGTRLGRSLPKPLTQLRDGRSILQRQLDGLRAVLGADVSITAVVGYRSKRVMKAAPDLLFAYNPDFAETMADVAVALRDVDRAVAEQVQVVFVTTDPATDTPEVLGSYLDNFDADLPVSFVGLTGELDAVVQAQLAAGVPQAEDEGRLHSTLLLLYGADDQARVAFDTGNDWRDIAADLGKVVGS